MDRARRHLDLEGDELALGHTTLGSRVPLGAPRPLDREVGGNPPGVRRIAHDRHAHEPRLRVGNGEGRVSGHFSGDLRVRVGG